MSLSRSRTSAAAIALAVSYFAKSWRDATSVISSRVRCERIVEMRTRNGSSLSATIFARVVSPSWRSPDGRYRRVKSRRTKSSRSRADAEVLKGLPRRVDGTGDQDDVLRTRKGQGRIDRPDDGRDRGGLCVRPEGGGDLFGVERPMGLRPARVDARGEGAQGACDGGQVLVVQDSRDEDRLP